MLAVARSVTPPGMAIDWYEANAEAMPLPDETFDAVLCQVGLQFVQNKPSALREMRRVLAPGGRLIVNVPGSISRAFVFFAEGLARHIDPQAATFIRAIFLLHDAGELQQLIKDAGFRDVAVRQYTKTLRLPAPKEFLWQYVNSTPLAGIVAQADDESRAALERDVVSQWHEFVEDGNLVIQQQIVVATARK
jgi:SAM-dependent methyltransferase